MIHVPEHTEYVYLNQVVRISFSAVSCYLNRLNRFRGGVQRHNLTLPGPLGVGRTQPLVITWTMCPQEGQRWGKWEESRRPPPAQPPLCPSTSHYKVILFVSEATCLDYFLRTLWRYLTVCVLLVVVILFIWQAIIDIISAIQSI